MEAVECGAASLGIVLSHYGQYVSLAELRRECGVTRDGSNAATLVKAARHYGLEAKGYSLEVQDLRGLQMPCIVFWNFNHFLVVDGVGTNEVFLNDPAVGHRRVSMAEFEEAFTGVVITTTPGPEFRTGGSRPLLLPALRSRLRGFESALLFALAAGFLLVIPGLIIPAFTQIFLDQVVIGCRSGWLRPLVAGILVVVGLQALLKFLQLRCLRRLHIALAARMSARFFKHLLSLPVDFYAQRFSGEISNRSNLNDKIAQVLSGQLAQTCIDVVMMGFYAALMFFYDARLTAIGVAFAAINFVALRQLSRWRVEANMRLLQESGKVTGTSIAGLQSIETIKASGLESGFFRRWAGYFANAANVQQDIGMTNQALGLLPALLSSLTTMFVLVVGGLFVIDGDLTIGSLVAFQMLMASFLRPVGSLVNLGQTIQELHGDMERLDDVLAHQSDPAAEPATGKDEPSGSGLARRTGEAAVARRAGAAGCHVRIQPVGVAPAREPRLASATRPEDCSRWR